MKKLFIILILLFTYTNVLSAYNKSLTYPVEKTEKQNIALNLNYLKNFYFDTKKILLSPLSWDMYDWFTASSIISSAILLSTEDKTIKNIVQSNRDKFVDSLATFAKPFGDGHYTIPPIAVFYIAGELFGNYKLKRTALLSFESFIISGIFTMAIKYTVNRERPSQSYEANVFHKPGNPVFSPAFPSGHSEAVFSIATILATEFSDTIFIPVIAYTIATMTALSRVNDNNHWTSDIIIGSAIGFFTAKSIESYHPYRHYQPKLSISPMISNNKTFLTINYSFK